MGVTKSDLFTDKQNSISILIKALGHPARIAIVEHLLKVDSCICGDLVDELPLSQPTISQHLKELKTAGLIKGTVEGTSVCYCIDDKSIGRIYDYFENIVGRLEKKKKNFC